MKNTFYKTLVRVPVTVMASAEENIFDNMRDDTYEYEQDEAVSVYENNKSEFDSFIDCEKCDLAKYVYEEDGELYKNVVRINIEGLDVDEGQLVLVIDVLSRTPDIVGTTDLLGYIGGQMSDGWGEGVEQREVMKNTTSIPELDFNPEDFEFNEEGGCDVRYWLSMKFESETTAYDCTDCGTVSIEGGDVVAKYSTPDYKLEVLKFTSYNDFLYSVKLCTDDLELYNKFLESVKERLNDGEHVKEYYLATDGEDFIRFGFSYNRKYPDETVVRTFYCTPNDDGDLNSYRNEIELVTQFFVDCQED